MSSWQDTFCFITLISWLTPLLLFSIPLSTHSWLRYHPYHRQPTNQKKRKNQPSSEVHSLTVLRSDWYSEKEGEDSCGQLCGGESSNGGCVCFKYKVYFPVASSEVSDLSPRSQIVTVSHPLPQILQFAFCHFYPSKKVMSKEKAIWLLLVAPFVWNTLLSSITLLKFQNLDDNAFLTLEA